MREPGGVGHRAARESTVDTIQAAIQVDCGDWLGPLRRIWANIGYDEIN